MIKNFWWTVSNINMEHTNSLRTNEPIPSPLTDFSFSISLYQQGVSLFCSQFLVKGSFESLHCVIIKLLTRFSVCVCVCVCVARRITWHQADEETWGGTWLNVCVRFTFPHFEDKIVPRSYVNVAKPQRIKRLIHLIKKIHITIYIYISYFYF